ncbi:MAG: hypothetical protein IH630_07425 [Thermoplasmata archaeon]|nr:hypothetical protein [Thermoplasmata archaeon]MCJ7561964.1 hypothetical protein [Thermoplasmata archaeon]TFG70064.1 MAG: hypothetical protein E4H25_03240 [Methanomassiliicoccus sp.]
MKAKRKQADEETGEETNAPVEAMRFGKKGTFITVKEEKRHLRRVVKAKPMSRKHMADALKAPKITRDDIQITAQVLDQFVAKSSNAPPRPVMKTFQCFECGTQMPDGSERCPKCRALYIQGIDEAEMEELLRAENLKEFQPEDFVTKEGNPLIHFDAELGILHYLQDDKGGPDFVFECTHCGTVVELNTDRCPICGTRLELGDTGLVGIFTDMEFDSNPLGEVDCPFCGQHGPLDSGKCSVCGQMVENPEGTDAGKIMPVLKVDNVVFLHLDIETGDVNYLQRAANKPGFEHSSVHLQGIGSSNFDQEWSGLSRI